MATKQRIVFMLACTVCKNRNYHFVRGRRKEKKVELNKFCPACGKHTAHKETK
jgi:large subunit ribosomal protein L33